MLSRLIVSQHSMLSMALGRSSISKMPIRNQFFREFHQQGRETISRSERIVQRQTTLKERIMAPAGPKAFAVGRGALAGGAALGLGALAFYGLGLGSNQNTIMNQSIMWPQHVRQRIHDTYAYFGGSVMITAASAAAVFRSPALMNMFARSGWVAMIATMALMMGSGMVAQSIPYEPGFGGKQLAWATHCAIMGAVLAPISFVGGQILVRAAVYTAGVIGGLSTVAVCAPNDRFLYMGGPLAIGLGVVFASSVGSMFLPPTTALGAGLYSMSFYGGLLLFSAFLLYDTQRIVRKAETHPYYAERRYDPVNGAISIYMDTMNIFIRIVTILAGGGNRRK